MKRKRFNWKLLIKLVNRYRADAEKCLEIGAYFAGLVSVRAALETMLIARFTLELLDEPQVELDEYGITVENDIVEIPGYVKLIELIQEARNQGLLSRSGYAAANRIRKWGNKIHCAQVAGGSKLPSIGRKNLQARLNDLNIVSEQLLRTL